MLQNIFSHRPPLYDLFAEAELRALPPLCYLEKGSVTKYLKREECGYVYSRKISYL